MRVYKPVSECPAKISELLTVVNMVPLDVEFPGFDRLKRIYRNRRCQPGDKFFNERFLEEDNESDFRSDYDNRLEELIREILENYPAALEYVFNPNVRFRFLFGARYYRWVDLRNRIAEVASVNSVYAFDRGLVEFFVPIKFTKVGQVDSKYTIDSAGRMTFEQDEIAEALSGHDALRLRPCPNCINVFWAKRTDAKTCGKQVCVDALQTFKKKEAKNRKRGEEEK